MKQMSFQYWYLCGARDEEADTTLVLFCVEPFFHINGYVNSQDKRYPPAANPMLIHKEPSHHVKVSAWYALSVLWISGTIFFPEIIN
jgi:hypothetical protein